MGGKTGAEVSNVKGSHLEYWCHEIHEIANSQLCVESYPGISTIDHNQVPTFSSFSASVLDIQWVR